MVLCYKNKNVFLLKYIYVIYLTGFLRCEYPNGDFKIKDMRAM